MRRIVVLVVLALSLTQLAAAAGWKKAYFGATKPGTWARYADHSSDPAGGDMTTTQTRLPDEDGQVRLESKMDSGGRYPLVVNRYTLKSGFAPDHDLIDYGPAIVAEMAGDGSATMQALDAATVALIAKAMPQYAPTAVFKGSETVDGMKADRYSYTLNHPGPTVETGDLWLSDLVPFGVVKNTFTMKDANGKTSTFARKLIASGADIASPKGSAGRTAVTSRTLKEAYDEGLIHIDATVDDASKNGERVHLHLSAKGDAPSPLTITVPKGKTSLQVGVPLDDFVFDAPAQTLVLTATTGADLEARQLGEHRALKGRFQISTYEGTPLWSGGATIGWVK